MITLKILIVILYSAQSKYDKSIMCTREKYNVFKCNLTSNTSKGASLKELWGEFSPFFFEVCDLQNNRKSELKYDIKIWRFLFPDVKIMLKGPLH